VSTSDSAFAFVIVDESTFAPGLEPADLARIAAALTVYANRDVGSRWGGSATVRVGTRESIAPGETVCAIRDALPEAPGDTAYHDLDGRAVPVVYVARSLCTPGLTGPQSLPAVLAHEIAETMGDPGCNRWADDGAGHEYAWELADAVQAYCYEIDGVSVSNFVYPSFFEPGAEDPYDHMGAVSRPLQTTPGGYQVVRTSGGGETQVRGELTDAQANKKAHPTSRTYQRGARLGATLAEDIPDDPPTTPETPASIRAAAMVVEEPETTAGRVVSVDSPAYLIDSWAPFSTDDLYRLRDATYEGEPIIGCGRYVENLTLDEVERIWRITGWGIFTIGCARTDSMTHPSSDIGVRDGQFAVAKLKALGVPQGVTHALDVEGTTHATADDVVAYENAATNVISSRADVAFYEGWGIPLGSSDLYHRIRAGLYWLSSPASVVPSTRGAAMVQVRHNVPIAGRVVDVSQHVGDRLGGRFHLWTA
jgi:hypothetical protein